jgi:hypothetical protein
MVGSKLTCPKLHFGQVEHGNNWGAFWSIFLVKKVKFSYNALNNHHPPMHRMFASLVGNDKHYIEEENEDNKMEEGKQPN